MRHTAITIAIVTSLSLAAQMLPSDGVTLTVYGLDAEIGECEDAVCDLSNAAITGQTGIHFEYYGDTLVRYLAGKQANWLRVSNDTIWSAGSDTRRSNIRHVHGLPYLLPRGNAGLSDSLRTNVFLSTDSENPVICRYRSGEGPAFILPGGDTVSNTYRIVTEVCDTAAVVRHSRWYAEGAVWPVVEQVTVLIGEDEHTDVHICPPGEQPRPRTYVKSSNGENTSGNIYGMLASIHGQDPTPGSAFPMYDGSSYDLTVTTEGISIAGEGTDRATVRLIDTAGRLWHEGTASAAITTSQLTPGVYLLEISSGGTSRTTKLIVTSR